MLFAPLSPELSGPLSSALKPVKFTSVQKHLEMLRPPQDLLLTTLSQYHFGPSVIICVLCAPVKIFMRSLQLRESKEPKTHQLHWVRREENKLVNNRPDLSGAHSVPRAPQHGGCSSLQAGILGILIYTGGRRQVEPAEMKPFIMGSFFFFFDGPK